MALVLIIQEHVGDNTFRKVSCGSEGWIRRHLFPLISVFISLDVEGKYVDGDVEDVSDGYELLVVRCRGNPHS